VAYDVSPLPKPFRWISTCSIALIVGRADAIGYGGRVVVNRSNVLAARNARKPFENIEARADIEN
jgi:hypothetical protein